MMPYAGWDMPVEYTGITAEHLAVRTRAGVFDVSHMGQIEIAGKDALATVQHMSCNDAEPAEAGPGPVLGPAHARRHLRGRHPRVPAGPSHFMLVVNAANVAKDYAWIVEQAKAVGEAAVVDSSSRYALIAVQGPAALDTVHPCHGGPRAPPVRTASPTARWPRRGR